MIYFRQIIKFKSNPIAFINPVIIDRLTTLTTEKHCDSAMRLYMNFTSFTTFIRFYDPMKIGGITAAARDTEWSGWASAAAVRALVYTRWALKGTGKATTGDRMQC